GTPRLPRLAFAAASLSQPNARPEPTASATASQITTAAADTPENSVVITSVPESTSSNPMITAATMFSQRAFVHGPSTSGSLQSSSRNRLALGSRTPASACTAVVNRPSGAPGSSTMPAASTTTTV